MFHVEQIPIWTVFPSVFHVEHNLACAKTQRTVVCLRPIARTRDSLEGNVTG